MTWQGDVRAQVAEEFRAASRRRYGVVAPAEDDHRPAIAVAPAPVPAAPRRRIVGVRQTG